MDKKLYGAILGDLAGQPYEFPAMKHFPKVEDINLHNPDSVITDDTLMTLATAKSILDDQPIEEAYKEIGLKYQGDHYGKGFKEWLHTPIGTVGKSWGNGCLMRISPYMYTISFDMLKPTVIDSCLTSHASSVRILASIELIEMYIESVVKKVMSLRDIEILPFEKFMVRADNTIDFCKKIYESHDSTHMAIKRAISCGGDTDTNASIVGELMNFTYDDLTDEDVAYVDSKLDPFLLSILKRFNAIEI